MAGIKKKNTETKDLVNVSQKSQIGQEKSTQMLHIMLILRRQHNLNNTEVFN